MKLRATWSACAGALATLALPAVATAADIPTVAAPPARMPVAVIAPPPRSSWYGTYIGIHGGYGLGGNAIAYTPNALYAAALPPAAIPQSSGHPGGYVAGITYGSNFQLGGVVIGTESDFSFTDIRRSETLGPVTGLAAQVTAEQRLRYFSTTRLRGGVLLGDHVLIFGTGGIASGSVRGQTAWNLNAPGACAAAGDCPSGARNRTQWGWTAGGGIEFAYGPWSLKADYLYYDLGTLNYDSVDPTLPAGAIESSIKVTGHIVKGGLNYRFNWTVFDLFMRR